MKILHVNNRFDWSGGAQTYLIQLIEKLEKRDVENVVVYSEKIQELRIIWNFLYREMKLK